MNAKKRILVTAGSTAVKIDKVRRLFPKEHLISNVFYGRTGRAIGVAAAQAGHDVTVLTSSVEEGFGRDVPGLTVHHFDLFDELQTLMEREIRTGTYDVVVHSAAVNDYYTGRIQTAGKTVRNAGQKKIKSLQDSLWVEFLPTPKLIDLIREPWGFEGTLVKFKLEVGISDRQLLRIAKRSMMASNADMIVANCEEWAKERAYILDTAGTCESTSRNDLPAALLRRLV